MDLILSSKKADKTIVEVEGVGGYYTWSSSQFPVLSQKKVAGGLLVLQPRGFALPHYADSSKIGYVCEGECIAGLISPEDSKEEVIKIQKGDALPITVGTVSWCNCGRVVIVGLFGKVVLDTKVEGNLFFVPKFFPFVVEADEGGIEFFSMKTSSK